MSELIVYPNASKGGITSVIRGRAIAAANTNFDLVFFDDRGGSQAFNDLSNVRLTIISRSRAAAAIRYLATRNDYDNISVLSAPGLVEHLAHIRANIRYEFHSSDMNVNKKEISSLALNDIDEITTPTAWMASTLRTLLPREHQRKLTVMPNLVDTRVFTPTGTTDFFDDDLVSKKQGTPLVWVGRFDEGKGYRHFIRALAALPEEYFGIVVVSLEKDPKRASDFFNECAAMGVLDRIEIYLNQSQSEMAKLYRWAAARNGRAISTSLLESFGYFVAEATACHLPVVAFDLPVWEEHTHSDRITSVPIGSVTSLVEAILSKQSVSS